MPDGPLASFCIADLTRVLAGPFCTMQLGDLGAEVIKIETPQSGDDTRAWGPPFVEGESAYFLSINRNKRSLSLNLKEDEGRAILWRILERCDGLVENFRPGTMERLGFGYPEVSVRFPRLVYCSISGFGQTGPNRSLPGYDLLIQGESGLMSLTGDKAGPPYKLGVSVSDLVAGMAACQGILAAFLDRERTGKGQHVDISMLDISASLLSFQAGIFFATGRVPSRLGNAHPTIVPYSTYPCRDGTLIVAVGNDALFSRLCQAIGAPELATDTRFTSASARVENRQALDGLLVEILAAEGRDHWIALLRAEGIPCGAVRDLGEVCRSPQLAARGMLTQMEHPRAGTIDQLGPAVKLSRTPCDLRLPPPLLGQHTEEILSWLGLEDDEIKRLRQKRAI
jgi:crotonobetainyl-CoA:carnitine CoA-transferase CaiB-like acyl-CoA transferase